MNNKNKTLMIIILGLTLVLVVVLGIFFFSKNDSSDNGKGGTISDLATVSQNIDNIDNLFGMLMEVNDETLKDYGIDPSLIEEYVMKIPMMNVQASMYLIAKPAAGQEAALKAQISDYFARLEEQWSMYLPNQYELVKNRLETKVGDYLVYIVSENNDLVLETIKQ